MLQAHDIGRLMGYGGLRIRQICEDTKCCINVGRNIPPGELIPVDIFAESHDGLTEAIRLVSKCFEGDDDSVTAYDSSQSASDSDAEDSAIGTRPRQNVKETYLVSAEMVCLLLLGTVAPFCLFWAHVVEFAIQFA